MSRFVVSYGTGLPDHPGNWRIVGAAVTAFGLHRFPQRPVTVYRHGANIGWYALHVARLMHGTGTVYAFEPAVEEFERLER